MLLSNLLAPTFTQMMRALSSWLDKAARHASEGGREPDAVLALRLAPDMFPLSSQVRFVCFQALEAVHRLKGEDVPAEALALRAEGWNAGEKPGSLAEAQARLAETMAFLDGAALDAFAGADDRSISLGLPNGMIFDMSAEHYARDWLLPQFYFHLVTAYAILRNAGVDLGKVDFVPHMFAYLRPGSAPPG